MTIQDFYTNGRTGLSFELFPPKSETGDESLFEHLRSLIQYAPDYITCTYGAGGSTQGRTLDLISRVKTEFSVPVASHLTVVGSTREQLEAYLGDAHSRSVDYIVALRGDPPQGDDQFRPVAGGLAYANELVELIKGSYPDFGIAVAGYPEKHREAPSMDTDLDNLKRKIDTGADIIITQLFYDNQDFFRFLDLCEQKQINVPIVPGILPVVSLKQIRRIASLCDAKLPQSFIDQLEQAEDPAEQLQVGIEFATRQVAELLEHDVCGLHFYVLNKSESTSRILENLEFNKTKAAGA